jgi:APA family basic amino acid/polyamine antiporter
MSAAPQPGLVRAIGRWTLAALLVNSIIGSGIFGLPSVVAGLLGHASPLGYLLGAAVMGVIITCFAEVASQFSEAGGMYLYTRAAFGSFLGIEVGWLTCLMRLSAAAGAVNLFVTYLGELWPAATDPLPRAAVITFLVGLLAGVNYLGVGAGARMSNIFTVAKLLPLFFFVAAGLYFVFSGARGAPPPVAPAHASWSNWFEATLLIIFAYGGWESALMPMGEARNPRRDAPFALGLSLLTVTILYTLLQVVVIHLLPDPASSSRPIADAARVFLGAAGAKLIAGVALVSLYGYHSAMMLNTPRLSFALAERGDFPRFFAAIHGKFHTPHVSIVLYAVLLWGLSLGGTFRWNIALSAVARLFGYGLVCAALPVLRRKNPEACAYRVPGGPFLAVLGALLTILLVTRMSRSELYVVLATMFLALLTWLWARRSAATRGLS